MVDGSEEMKGHIKPKLQQEKQQHLHYMSHYINAQQFVGGLLI